VTVDDRIPRSALIDRLARLIGDQPAQTRARLWSAPQPRPSSASGIRYIPPTKCMALNTA